MNVGSNSEKVSEKVECFRMYTIDLLVSWIIQVESFIPKCASTYLIGCLTQKTLALKELGGIELICLIANWHMNDWGQWPVFIEVMGSVAY